MTEKPNQAAPSKKLYIKTYGCQMNVYDSTRMADVLAPLGYSTTDQADQADLVILNTCHIREKAEDKVYSDLGRLRLNQKEKSARGEFMIIAVGGCVGQAAGEEIIHRAPYVDMVFGPQSYHKLPEMVTKAIRGQGGIVELDFPAIEKFDALPRSSESQGVTAFLAVQEGCDKFCTFCVVPYTRGAEYSRSVDEVLFEARQMAAKGAIEITLLGQNVNAYHGIGPDGKDWNLAKLIEAISKIPGIERIRYMTSHPRDMDDDLIAAHGYNHKLMPFLHLPVQSGSDAILKRMNRRHNAEFYMNIIHRIRTARPDIALSSDFIVGFPGETEKDFHDTMRVVESVGYAQAYSFKYSPRPGTPASTEEVQVPEEEKSTRLTLLQGLLMRQQQAFNQMSVGQTVKVLFEKEGKREGQILGKTPYLQSVYVKDAAQFRDQLVNVTITKAFQNSLTGEIATNHPVQSSAA